ncbi:MAG: FAD-dependent oxidoreductase [Nitrospiraceae bacterium]|nr:FAD-dependent oxidoreductase [Nitrospiraceae bacterium]
MPRYDYDLIVIGAGAAGFVTSKIAAGMGKKVAMIEKNLLGGECTNAGCVPSKALLKAARVAHQTRHLETYGLSLAGNPVLSAKNAMAYARAAVKKVSDSHPASVFEKAGIAVLFGSPRFLDNHLVDLDGTVLSASKFMICTGTSAAVPAIEGIESVPYYTNENIFAIEDLPSSLAVLGAGPVGIELAQAFSRLGVPTTVIAKYDAILPHEDRELARMLAGRLQEEGIRILPETRVLNVSREGETVNLTAQRSGRRETVKSAALLVAVGRAPNTAGLDLENAGVAYGAKGIRTDAYLRTTARNIYACGDVVGPYQFSHMAEYQAITATRNALLPFRKRAVYNTVVWCTFTDPELAHAGITEEEARTLHGESISVLRYDYANIDRSRTDSTSFGMAKFICDRRGMLLGAHILGERAGELIHEAQLLRHLRRPFTDLSSMIHAYPTYTDVVRQPAKYYYIDRLRKNPLVKIAARLFGKRRT